MPLRGRSALLYQPLLFSFRTRKISNFQVAFKATLSIREKGTSDEAGQLSNEQILSFQASWRRCCCPRIYTIPRRTATPYGASSPTVASPTGTNDEGTPRTRRPSTPAIGAGRPTWPPLPSVDTNDLNAGSCPARFALSATEDSNTDSSSIRTSSDARRSYDELFRRAMIRRFLPRSESRFVDLLVCWSADRLVY